MNELTNKEVLDVNGGVIGIMLVAGAMYAVGYYVGSQK